MKTDTNELISQWNETLQNKIEFSLILNNSEQSTLFKKFCSEFSASASNVSIAIKKDGDAEEPYIKINDHLIFKALPEDKLLKIFLNFLTNDKPRPPQKLSDKLKDKLKNLSTPVRLKIFISPFCPYCPKVIEEIGQFSFIGNDIEIIIIDGSLFKELAEKETIVSAPTVVFNENFRWTGAVNPNELAEVLGELKPEDLSPEALRNLVETGRASVLADLMTEAEIIFPAFYDLITHEKWPVRLGAMVAMEEIAVKNPLLAEEAIETLWKNFTNYDDSVKGDIIYITGESGSLKRISQIKAIIKGDYSEDLKEVAAEAAESLKEKLGDTNQ